MVEMIDLWGFGVVDDAKSTRVVGMVNAKRVKDDEWYTSYDDVKNELQHWQHRLTGKRIICPCDGEQSAFVKYLNEVKEDWGIKSITFSCYNPYNNSGISFEDIDFKQYDICITNPPFSKYQLFLQMLLDANIDFILIAPLLNRQQNNFIKLIQQHKLYFGYIKSFNFIATNTGKIVPCQWITSFNDFNYNTNPKFIGVDFNMHSYDIDWRIEFDDGSYAIIVPLCKYLPTNYNGWMRVSIMALNYINIDDYFIFKSDGSCHWFYDVKNPIKWRTSNPTLNDKTGKYEFTKLYIKKR